MNGRNAPVFPRNRSVRLRFVPFYNKMTVVGDNGSIRINRFVAGAGICSRRKADELIDEGRVKVNGKTVLEKGTCVDPRRDSVSVDGNPVKYSSEKTYVMLNKPKGCLCSASDDRGRKTVFDYLDTDRRLFYAGRLDYDAEGLLILTDDGDLVKRLTHPSSCVPKTYLVKTEGEVHESSLARLRKGMAMDGADVRPKIKRKTFENNVSSFEITLFEGKNREIHRLFEEIGKEVIFIKRIKIGELRLGGLPRGSWRTLSKNEVGYLKSL